MRYCKWCNEQFLGGHPADPMDMFCDDCKWRFKCEKKTSPKIPFEWEKIYEKDSISFQGGAIGLAYRAKVFGGWLVKEIEILPLEKSHSITKTVTFVADSKHEWEI